MGWKKVSQASKHFGISIRSFRDLLKDTDFPHSRLPSGTILIELQAGDEWLRSRSNSRQDSETVNEILRGLEAR